MGQTASADELGANIGNCDEDAEGGGEQSSRETGPEGWRAPLTLVSGQKKQLAEAERERDHLVDKLLAVETALTDALRESESFAATLQTAEADHIVFVQAGGGPYTPHIFLFHWEGRFMQKVENFVAKISEAVEDESDGEKDASPPVQMGDLVSRKKVAIEDLERCVFLVEVKIF